MGALGASGQLDPLVDATSESSHKLIESLREFMSQRAKILLTGLSVLVLLLVLVNIVIGIGNQSVQSEVSERQQVIAQTMQLEALNRQLINVLANLALKTNDEPLMGVLAAAGINLQAGPQTKPPTK
jgi:cell division protein FtsL